MRDEIRYKLVLVDDCNVVFLFVVGEEVRFDLGRGVRFVLDPRV
jgi:hypothetical protein